MSATSGTSPVSGVHVILDAADRLVGADVNVRGVRRRASRCRATARSVKALSSDDAAMLTVQYFFASLIDFFDHSPVLT